jgi:molecular chaperone GrpE
MTDPAQKDADRQRGENGDERRPRGDAPEETAMDDGARAAAAEAKAEESWNNYLRAAAELENVRRRAQRDIENAHKFGLEKFAQELLPVKDSLELGLEMGADQAGQIDARTLLAGKEATLRLLERAFQKFNLKEINPVGEPFNPQLHEAMQMQESATAEPDSVLQVVQKGYELNGRLLRPARVIVARAPAGRP